MMKKTFFLLSALTFIGNGIHAQVVYGNNEQLYVKSRHEIPVSYVSPSTDPPSPIDGQAKYKLSGLGDNWFVSAQGGFISFLGDPVSHTDFNGRTKVGLEFSFGKWHSPYFGTRLAFQGFKFVDSQRTSQSFGIYHADLLLNVSSFFRPSFEKPAKWNISPYVGAGLVRHNRLKKTSFALSYGIWGVCSLSERISVSVSLAGTTARRDFDGYGEKGRFGDNLLSGSIGLDIGIGYLGWKVKKHKLVSANEDVLQNPTITDLTTYPRNNYSGLKSLQERLANVNTESVSGNIDENIAQFDAPILFFFKRNTTELVDKQQLVNIQEIAAAVKEYNLEVRIVGSADSKTGTPKHNRKLSIKRCRYIAKLLINAGVPKSKMTGATKGGINLYKPYTANRHTCVILYKQK